MSTPDMELILTDEMEEPFGWIFWYNHRKYVETRDFAYAIAGNAPLLVLRQSGEVKVLGTAHPVEHYLEQYRMANGDIR